MRPITLSLALLSCLCSGFLNAQSTPRRGSAQPWWKHAFIYEIYPRSFQDSNGDGVGDLNGITSASTPPELGVDAIWIAPMYPSPRSISATISPTTRTSTRNTAPWRTSTASRRKPASATSASSSTWCSITPRISTSGSSIRPASRNNPKADWYVWNAGIPADTPGVTAYQKKYAHDGVGVRRIIGSPLFGGSAWEWVPARKQFYYHKFYKQQPDLNWRNPAVETAMFDVMRFWLDRGVAGFRLDAVPTLFEDPQLRNEPETGGINAQGDPNLNDSTPTICRRCTTSFAACAPWSISIPATAC